jgi:hypothetical protein
MGKKSRKNNHRRRKTRIQNNTRILAKRSLGYSYGYTRVNKSQNTNSRRKLRSDANIRRLKGIRHHLRERRRRERLRKGLLNAPTYKSIPSPIKNKKNTICRNRYVRAQVLHALRKTGKTGQKKPIRRYPNIICRRK